MLYNRKLFLKLALAIILVVLIFIFFAYKNLNIIKKEEIIVRVGDVYQKVAITSGAIAQTSLIERDNLSDFSGLPDKNDREFHKNYTLIHSENKNKVLVASFVGQGENAKKQREFTCDLSKKECAQSKLLFNNYKIGNLDIMAHSVWWLGWNSKRDMIIGMVFNEVNNGKVYVCDTNNQTCQETPKDKLNFPQGAINKSLDKMVAIRQHDIINEKTGDKWELLLYDTKNLNESLKTYDISSAIDRDEDIFYDGINSIAWSKNNRTILIGTTRNIFKFNLNSGKLDKIFTDTSDGDNDFYWNSDQLKFSSAENYAIFVDTVSIGSSNEESGSVEDTEIEEGVLKVVDLKNENKVSEIFQAKDLVLK